MPLVRGGSPDKVPLGFERLNELLLTLATESDVVDGLPIAFIV